MIISGGAREQKLHCNLFVFLKTDCFLLFMFLFFVWLFVFLIFVLVFGHWPNNTALSLISLA